MAIALATETDQPITLRTLVVCVGICLCLASRQRRWWRHFPRIQWLYIQTEEFLSKMFTLQQEIRTTIIMFTDVTCKPWITSSAMLTRPIQVLLLLRLTERSCKTFFPFTLTNYKGYRHDLRRLNFNSASWSLMHGAQLKATRRG